MARDMEPAEDLGDIENMYVLRGILSCKQSWRELMSEELNNTGAKALANLEQFKKELLQNIRSELNGSLNGMDYFSIHRGASK